MLISQLWQFESDMIRMKMDGMKSMIVNAPNVVVVIRNGQRNTSVITTDKFSARLFVLYIGEKCTVCYQQPTMYSITTDNNYEDIDICLCHDCMLHVVSKKALLYNQSLFAYWAICELVNSVIQEIEIARLIGSIMSRFSAVLLQI